MLFLAWRNDKQTDVINGTENEQETEQGGDNVLLVSTGTIIQSDAFFNIKAEYPQFAEADSGFNDKINALISGKVETFKQDAQGYWEARKATAGPGEIIPDEPEMPFDFIAEWQEIQVNDKYISFVINIYHFAGGAHGISEIHAFNYDVINKKEITINDFLENSQQALDKLSELSAQEITLQLESSGIQMDSFLEQMVSDGTEPTAENYANFSFGNNSLKIYFQQYQVAPGAVGQVIVIFSKEILEQNSIMSDYLQF